MANKFSIYINTYLCEKSGIPLLEVMEARKTELMKKAPIGLPPYSLWVQPNGEITKVIVSPEIEAFEDELALRKNKGSKYAESLQKKSTKVIEEISHYDVLIREIREALSQVQIDHEQILHNSPLLYSLKQMTVRDSLLAHISALGEILMLMFLWANISGIDPTKFGKALTHNPSAVMITFISVLAIFWFIREIADKFNASETFRQRTTYASILLFIGCIIALLRLDQLGTMSNTVSKYAIVIFYCVGSIGSALVSAHYRRKASDYRTIISATESSLKRLSDRRLFLMAELENLVHLRQVRQNKLDILEEEFGSHYERSERERQLMSDAWSQFLRSMEAQLAEVRLAYLFWRGRRIMADRRNSAKRRMLPAIATVGMIVFVFLIFSGCGVTDNGGFNVILNCDQSSSAMGYSSSKEQIINIAKYWMENADSKDGGVFEIGIIGSGFDDATILFSEHYPESFSAPVLENKKTWQKDFVQRVMTVLNNMPTNRGSAIAEGIMRNSLRIPEDGHTAFIIASDMREVDKHFNFERKVPSPEKFLQWLDTNDIKPKFTPSTEVIICGVHPYSPRGTSKMSSKEYSEIISIWTRVFRQWGMTPYISERWDFTSLTNATGDAL